MSKAKILIVEDESIVALDIASKLTSQGYIISGIADNCKAALDLISINAPDLILLDINIKGEMDGIKTAELIHKTMNIPVIFISALSDRATLERAKATTPFAYLLKPFRDIDLNMAIELAFSQMANPMGKIVPDNDLLYQLDDRIFIKTGNGKFEKIMLTDLVYLKAERSYCTVYTSHKHYTLSVSLNHLLDQISFPNLHRVHKSYAVNTQMITAFLDGCVSIEEMQIPIGAAYKSSFLSMFKMMR